MKSLRIVFMGTPDFAVASLQALSESDHNIVAVVTVPDKPAGRGQKLQESAVKKYAVSRGYPILQPDKLKEPSFVEPLRNYQADVFVVVAFRMLPEIVWSMPPMGTINLHGSLLPQYRGAAPIHWAVINGETITGVTTFLIEKEIDTGRILLHRELPIGPHDTTGIVHDQLMLLGADLLKETVDTLSSGQTSPISQKNILPTTLLKPAPKIHRETCRIDWGQPAGNVYNLIRGLSPYPTAWTTLRNPKGEFLNLKIYFAEKEFAITMHEQPGVLHTDHKTFLKIACANGWLHLTDLQLEGKKRMPVTDFLRGVPDIDVYTIRKYFAT